MSMLKQSRYFEAHKHVKVQEDATQDAIKQSMHFENELFEQIEPIASEKVEKKQNHWWVLAGITLLLLVFLACWQWAHVLIQSWHENVFKAGLLSLVTLGTLVLLGSLLYKEVKLWRRLARNKQYQQSAVRISNSVQFGEADKLCEQIAADLPVTEQIKEALISFNQAKLNEHTDQEKIQLFEHLVLSPLDKKAQSLIYKGASDTSLAVAVSPFALADMLLVIWRSSKMLRELAELYGASLGQLRSLVLLKQLFAALFWAGGSELALDMASDVLSSEMTAKISVRAGQGVIAGLLVARLGNLAQQALRPLPSTKTSKVSIKALTKTLYTRFTSALQTKADS